MLGWKIFFFQNIMYFFIAFIALIISVEKSPIRVAAPFLFLAAFRFFVLHLIMSSFIIMQLSVVFFVFIVLGICDASWIYRLKSYTLDEKMLNFSSNTVFALLPHHFLRLQLQHIRPFNYVLYILHIFCVVSMFPFRASIWIFSADSSSNSLIFQLCLICC